MARMDWGKARDRDLMRGGSYDDPRREARLGSGPLPATGKQLQYMKTLSARTGKPMPSAPITRNMASKWISQARADQTMAFRQRPPA